MAFEKLQEAVDQLKRYNEMPDVSNVPLSLLSPRTEGAPAQVTTSEQLANLLINVSRGSKSAKKIAEKISDLRTKSKGDEKDILDRIKIYTEDNPLDPAAKISTVIGRVTNASKLSVIQIDTVRLGQANRLVDAVAIFLNAIPTLEMSRCVPYLTVEVQAKRPPTSADGKAQGMSLMRFLQGSIDVREQSVNRNLLLGLQTDIDGNVTAGDAAVTNSGMELFTSPQTLVDPSVSIDGLRSAPVIDKFRPFMSIEKLTVDVTAQVGPFSYRTATLDVTLHDRSRLNEIADFVKPDLYGSTELMIEYGWSHPDASGQNVYATLLNSMRIREKYGIVNSSFSFTKTGGVKIKLKLFTKGYYETQTVTIGDDADRAKSAREALQELQQTITEIRVRVMQDDTTRAAKEIRGEQQLFAHGEDIGTAIKLTPEAQQAVRKFIQKNDKGVSGDLKVLRDSLLQLYGKDGRGTPGSKVGDFKDTVAGNIRSKVASIKGGTETDPFLKTGLASLEKLAKEKSLGNSFSKLSNGYVSFGRLMSVFVGQPMAMKDPGFDDVQLVFYPFNAKAAACANLNIAEFPVKIDELEKGFAGFAVDHGLAITVEEFVKYIANNFIDDITNRAYGLQLNYHTKFDPQTGIRVNDVGKDVDESHLLDNVAERLRKMGVQDGVFKMPQLAVTMETVPMDVAGVDENAKIESGKTVLKIHFFDTCCSSYESMSQLIRVSRENTIDALGNIAVKSDSDLHEHAATYRKALDDAHRAGLLEIIPAKDAKGVSVYNARYDFERLKTFIRQNMPSIVYGANNTNIIDANFATIQEPRLSTIHMRKGGGQGSLSPTGLTRANLPLMVLPATVSLTMAGCPLIYFMQMFFIDFGTNTTADNIYAVTKLSHEISRGRFETKADLIIYDAWGRYNTLAAQIGVAIQKLDMAIESQDSGKPST